MVNKRVSHSNHILFFTLAVCQHITCNMHVALGRLCPFPAIGAIQSQRARTPPNLPPPPCIFTLQPRNGGAL